MPNPAYSADLSRRNLHPFSAERSETKILAASTSSSGHVARLVTRTGIGGGHAPTGSGAPTPIERERSLRLSWAAGSPTDARGRTPPDG